MRRGFLTTKYTKHTKEIFVTTNEAGIIAGIPTGATIGAVIGKAHGTFGVISGLSAGAVSGAIAGWLYAFIFICLLSAIGVFWRAVQKRADKVPSEDDIALMTPIANRGVFIGILVALICWFNFGWLQAITAALMIGVIAAFIAVARFGLR